MSSVEYIPTSRPGRNYLAFNGYLFVKERECGSKIIWKCKDFQKLRCKARVHVAEDVVVKVGLVCSKIIYAKKTC